MAVAVGTASLFKVDTAGGGVYVSIAEQLDGTLEMSRDMIEGTTKDSSQKKVFKHGNFSWTASVTLYIESTAGGDTDGLILCQTAITTAANVDFQLLETGTALTYTGSALVSGISKSFPQNGVQTATINLQGTAALTIA